MPPHFSIPPENTEVMPGGDVNLTCVAVGSPMPIVRWVQGAKEITQDDEVPVGRNILMLTDVRETKNYTCVASSDLGTIEHTAQIQVKGKAFVLHGTPAEVSSFLHSPHFQTFSGFLQK